MVCTTRAQLAALRATVRGAGAWGCGLNMGESWARRGRNKTRSWWMEHNQKRQLSTTQQQQQKAGPPSRCTRALSLAQPAHEEEVVYTWTGLDPVACPGFDRSTGALGSLGQPRLDGATEADTRRVLEKYFENTWTLTEVLFTSLRDESVFYEPPKHGLRHPLIFYFGHPAALAVNKLRLAGHLTGPVNAYFEDVFETGVDEMRWDDVVDPTKSRGWPSIDQVVEYRAKVRQLVLDVIRQAPDLDTWCVAMICEHERIHLETSSVLIRELPINLVKRPDYWPPDHPGLSSSSSSPSGGDKREHADEHDEHDDEQEATGGLVEFRPYEQGTVTLGKPTKATYGWDNEFGRRVVEVQPFEGSDLITNGAFLKFVEDGGYSDPSLWSEAGWGWRTFRNVKWPHFWVSRGPAGLHDYVLRLPFEELDHLPLDLPVEVNAHEARAFAKWMDKIQPSYKHGLCTEAEFTLRETQVTPRSLEHDPALVSSSASSLNVNLAHGSPSPVDGSMRGNVWQWCEDDFAPLPGFKVDALYDDFSTPCFDGQHTVIMGGSFVSTGNEASHFARFHFRPHFHQHAGFRLSRYPPSAPPPELTSYDAPPPHAQNWRPHKYADVLKKFAALSSSAAAVSSSAAAASSSSAGSAATDEEGAAKYETDAQLSAYLDLHFGGNKSLAGPAAEVAELGAFLGFPERCAEILTKALDRKPDTPKKKLRALDVGCAVGGASLALADTFDQVVGLDFSEKFVETARAMATGAAVRYARAELAGRTSEQIAQRDSETTNASFVVGDACDRSTLLNLAGDDKFDAVLCANLLCRLPEPRVFVESLPDVVAQDGVVLFASPYSWFQEYTPDPTSWYLGPDQLVAHMTELGFELVSASDQPLLIRDHQRKFQLIFSNALAFKKL